MKKNFLLFVFLLFSVVKAEAQNTVPCADVIISDTSFEPILDSSYWHILDFTNSADPCLL
jgi:hypothetical protein